TTHWTELSHTSVINHAVSNDENVTATLDLPLAKNRQNKKRQSCEQDFFVEHKFAFVAFRVIRSPLNCLTCGNRQRLEKSQASPDTARPDHFSPAFPISARL